MIIMPRKTDIVKMGRAFSTCVPEIPPGESKFSNIPVLLCGRLSAGGEAVLVSLHKLFGFGSKASLCAFFARGCVV